MLSSLYPPSAIRAFALTSAFTAATGCVSAIVAYTSSSDFPLITAFASGSIAASHAAASYLMISDQRLSILYGGIVGAGTSTTVSLGSCGAAYLYSLLQP